MGTTFSTVHASCAGDSAQEAQALSKKSHSRRKKRRKTAFVARTWWVSLAPVGGLLPRCYEAKDLDRVPDNPVISPGVPPVSPGPLPTETRWQAQFWSKPSSGEALPAASAPPSTLPLLARIRSGNRTALVTSAELPCLILGTGIP